jgi:ATP synthase subunit 6
MLSPLEQFQLLPFFAVKSIVGTLILSNLSVFLFIQFFIFFIVAYSLSSAARTMFIDEADSDEIDCYIVPTRFQILLESLQKFILKMIGENIMGNQAQFYFPIVFFLFIFIALMNVVGLIPNTFNLTSQLVLTVTIGISMFIGINFIGFRKNKHRMALLFLPSGAPFSIGVILVPLEIISYCVKPISSGVRIFANMVAGHTLMKVIAGFSISLMALSGFLVFPLQFLPYIVIMAILILEFAVSLIQAFVFSLLISIYIHDALNLH